MRMSFAATLALAASLGIAAPASAQQTEWTAGDEDRSTILRFLERDDVGGVAGQMGVDVQDAGRGVLEMNDADAARVADQVRDAEHAMADSITITTTALIIGLLILIVLILVL